jgi:GNAT superfamily N-acetyltransferase
MTKQPQLTAQNEKPPVKGLEPQYLCDTAHNKQEDNVLKKHPDSAPSTKEEHLGGENMKWEDPSPQQRFDQLLKQMAANPKKYKQQRQNAVYVTIPSNDAYVSFIKLYQERLRESFQHYSVNTAHNCFGAAHADPEVYFPTTYYRGKVQVCIYSDNETFTLKDGENGAVCVTFRPFGQNTIELSRIFVDPDYRKMGIGTELVKLSQKVARELNARLTLLPASPLAAEVRDKKAESRRLRKWYIRLGFVNCLPEMFHGFRLINNDPIYFGLCGLMVFR